MLQTVSARRQRASTSRFATTTAPTPPPTPPVCTSAALHGRPPVEVEPPADEDPMDVSSGEDRASSCMLRSSRVLLTSCPRPPPTPFLPGLVIVPL